MIFTTKLFVADLLKYLGSCQFNGYWFAPKLRQFKTSVTRQLSQLVITVFTESLAAKATHIHNNSYSPRALKPKRSSHSLVATQQWLRHQFWVQIP